jgi:hypothetical protein
VSRKKALLEKVEPIIARYARVHSIEEGYCSAAAQALADHDLAVIPLLHNPALLKSKIEETFTVLQHRPNRKVKVELKLDTNRLQRLHPPTESEIEHIRNEVAKIDPIHVDDVMPMMLQNLAGLDIQGCLNDQRAIASRYDIVKKQFESEGAVQTAPPSPGNAAGVLADGVDTINAFERLDLASSTIHDLLKLPSREILSNLQGAEGDALLSKLGIDRPTDEDRSRVATWTSETMAKQGLERKVEMSGMLAKKLDVSVAELPELPLNISQFSLKKSQKTKYAKSIVNAESDDEAVCLL